VARQSGWRRSLRAVALGGVGLGVAALLWQLRPSGSLPRQPDSEIVAACEWLAWALTSYLCLAVAGTAVGALVRWRGLGRIAPAALRRLVDSAISVGLVAAVVAPTAAVATPARPSTVATSPVRPHAPALDWPGLTVAMSPQARQPASRSGSASNREVVVRPGDTLWSIAAAHLGPGASRERIAASWPRWYAANRSVVGPDPAVIRPGEHLRPPANDSDPEKGTP